MNAPILKICLCNCFEIYKLSFVKSLKEIKSKKIKNFLLFFLSLFKLNLNFHLRNPIKYISKRVIPISLVKVTFQTYETWRTAASNPHDFEKCFIKMYFTFTLLIVESSLLVIKWWQIFQQKTGLPLPNIIPSKKGKKLVKQVGY